MTTHTPSEAGSTSPSDVPVARSTRRTFGAFEDVSCLQRLPAGVCVATADDRSESVVSTPLTL